MGYWKDGKQSYHDTTELNKALEEGWKVVSATSGHVSVGGGGGAYSTSAHVAPILVIIEK